MKPLNLDPNVNYLAQGPDVKIPEWKKSLSAFAHETTGFGAGLAALGAQVTGFEGTRDRALENYQRNMEEAQSGWRAPEVGRIEDIKDAGDFASWASYQLPKGLGTLGTMLLGGGVGGVIAKATASTAAKQLAKEYVKDQAQNLATKEAGRLAAKSIAKRTAVGAHAGALGSAFGMEAGQSYGQFANDPEIGPEKAVGPAATYGAIAAGLEYTPFYLAAKALGLGKDTLRTIIRGDQNLSKQALALAGKVGKGVAAGAVTEGITEGMQTLVQHAAEKYAKENPNWAEGPKTPEEWSEFWNAWATGTLVGSVAGGVIGPMSGGRAAPEVVSPEVAPPGEVETAPTTAPVPPAADQPQPAPTPVQPATGQPPVAPQPAPTLAQPAGQPPVAGSTAPTVGQPPTVSTTPTAAPTQQTAEVVIEPEPEGTWRVITPDGIVAAQIPTKEEAEQIAAEEVAKRETPAAPAPQTDPRAEPAAAPTEQQAAPPGSVVLRRGESFTLTPGQAPAAAPLTLTDGARQVLEASRQGQPVDPVVLRQEAAASGIQTDGLNDRQILSTLAAEAKAAPAVVPPAQTETTGSAAPMSTADQITTAMGGIAGGLKTDSLVEVAKRLTNGKSVVYTKEASAAAAAVNPDYNTQTNPDGSVQVLGVNVPGTGWVGVAPAEVSGAPAARGGPLPDGASPQAAPTTEAAPIEAAPTEVPVATIRRANGKPFATKESAEAAREREAKPGGKLRIEVGKDKGREARARVVQEGDGWVVQKLESRETRFGEAPTAGTTATRESLTAAVRSILGRDDNWRLHIYDTPEQAVADGIPADRLGGTSGRGAYGFVDERNGKLHATFILGRIPEGGELPALMHEIGAHIGLESVLTPTQLNRLASRVIGWAKDGTGIENEAARAALKRVADAKTPAADRFPEIIAYFIEEAVARGVNPTALKGNTALEQWFRSLWAAFKQALRRLRVANIDKLTGQNVVDLAYGAARLELAGHWHGSRGPFRRFDSRYMSSGAGDQWYSWGHYIAKRKGIGEYYREMVANDTDKPYRVKITLTDGDYYLDDLVKSSHMKSFSLPMQDVLQQLAAMKTGIPLRDKLEDILKKTGAPDIVTRNLGAFRAVGISTLEWVYPWIDAEITSLYPGLPGLIEKVDQAIARDLRSGSRSPGDSVIINAQSHLRMIKSWYKDNPNQHKIDNKNNAAARWILTNKHRFSEEALPDSSQLHRVDVNVRPEETMHWDKPLSEQPKEIWDNLYGRMTYKENEGVHYIDVPHLGEVAVDDTMTGGEFYATLVAREHGRSEADWRSYRNVSSKAASMWLDSIGIKGMEHWDEPSRKKINKWETTQKIPDTRERLRNADGERLTTSQINSVLGGAGARGAVVAAKSIDAAIENVKENNARLENLLKDGKHLADSVRTNFERFITEGKQTISALNEFKKRGYYFGPEKRTPFPKDISTNLVVFNDRNIISVGRAPGGDLSQVRYGEGTMESRTSTPAHTTIDFVSASDSILGQGWTQRALDAGILQVNETSEPGSASGTYDPQTEIFTVNLDRTPRGQSVADVLLHEGSHAGMERMLGKQFAQFHTDLERLATQGSPTAQMALLQSTTGIVDALNRQRDLTGGELIESRLGDETLPKSERAAELQRVREMIRQRNPALLREEDMAYYVQLASSANPKEGGYWKRLQAAISAWFTQTGFGKALAALGWRPEMSPQLAVALAKRATQQTLARAELTEKLLGEKARVLRMLPVSARVGVMESRATPKWLNPLLENVVTEESVVEETLIRVRSKFSIEFDETLTEENREEDGETGAYYLKEDGEDVIGDDGYLKVFYSEEDAKDYIDKIAEQEASLNPEELAMELGKELSPTSDIESIVGQIPKDDLAAAWGGAPVTPLAFALTDKPIVAKVYHGTPDANFIEQGKEFSTRQSSSENGVVFTDSIELANEYTRTGGGKSPQGAIAIAYIRSKTPYVIDAKGKSWEELSNARVPLHELVRTLESDGNDSLIVKNLEDTGKDGKKSIVATQVWVVGENQIKYSNSPFLGEGLLESRLSSISDPASYWRSGVAESISAAPQAKAAPAQWLGWLKKQPRVKQEEIDDLGLEDWLETQEGAVTKEKMLGFVRAGGVRIEEVLRGADAAQIPQYWLTNENGDVDGPFTSRAEAVRVQEENPEAAYSITEGLGEDIKSRPVHKKFTLPGGENYRELVITVPTKGASMEKQAREELGYTMDDTIPEDEQAELDARIQELASSRGPTEQATYRSSHWSEPNVLVHIRFDERTAADGSRVLFVQEVQSDWHQEGKKKGYASNSQELTRSSADSVLILRQAPEGWWEAAEGNHVWGLANTPEEALDRGIDGYNAGLRTKVPDAPLKSGWPLLGMKRAIRWAAENGFDRVAWPAEAEQLVNQGGWGSVIEQDGKWITENDTNVTSIVNRYRRDLPKALERYGKRFGAKVGRTEIENVQDPAWSITVTPQLREEAIAGQLLYSMPLTNWDISGWYTSPTAAVLEERNQPGATNKAFHSMIDAFQYVKNWDKNVYRRLDEMRNIIGARHEVLKRELVEPIRSLLRAYTPTGAQTKIFRDMGMPEPNATELRGHQLAALHIARDGHAHGAKDVNQYLARKAAPEALNRLRRRLPKAGRQALENQIAAHFTGNQTPDAKKLDPAVAHALFLKFYGKSKKWERFLEVGQLLHQGGLTPQVKAALEKEYDTLHVSAPVQLIEGMLLMEHRGAGYSTALKGTAEYKRDRGEGFLNVHDLLRDDVLNDPNFQKLRELTQRAARLTLDTLRGESDQKGIFSDADVTLLSTLYPNYVPTHRADFDFDYAMRKALEKPREGMMGLMERKGSPNRASAANVIANLLAQNYAAVTAVTRNEVIADFAAAVDANPALWRDKFKVVAGPREHAADIAFTRRTADGKKQNLYLRPVAENLRAVATAAYLAKLDAQQIKGPLKIMQHVNNWIRWTAISANPLFLMATAPRDYLTAAYNLQAGDAAKFSRKIASWGEYVAAFKALKQVVMDDKRQLFTGPNLTPEQLQHNANIELVEAMERAGGKVSFTQSLRTGDSTTWQSLDQQVWRGHGKRQAVVEFGEKALAGIENLNIVIENVMRLSTFKTMREEYQKQGLSKEEATAKAAELARNLTTNFTRRGAHIDTINVWWLFYNATVQGNWQVVQNLLFNDNKKGAKRLMAAVGGTVLFAFMLDLLGRALDDDWDEVDPWQKDRNILMPGLKVGGDYVSIPSPWVFNVFWRMGGMLGEVAAGKRSLSDMGLDLAGLVTSTMDPIGGGKALTGDVTWLQAAAPSSFDWFAQIQENKNFVGNPLGPTGLGTSDKPDAYTAWDSTPKGYKHAAQFINEVTGGNVAESGLIDLRPSTLQVMTEFALGGLGRFGLDVVEMTGLVGEKDLFQREGPADVPFTKVFFTSPSDSTAISMYHDRIAQVLSTKRLIKEYSEGPNRDPRKLAETRQERAALLRMLPQAEDVERQITSLRKAVRTAQARKDSRTEEQLRERIVQLQKRFNSSFARRVGA